jgi:hypothetical protein
MNKEYQGENIIFTTEQIYSKYIAGICMSLALGLTAGFICRLAMSLFSSLQCLIYTDGLTPV